MRYITPEIEINAVQVEDIMAASDSFNIIVNSGNAGSSGPSITESTEEDGSTGANINIGADFFG